MKRKAILVLAWLAGTALGYLLARPTEGPPAPSTTKYLAPIPRGEYRAQGPPSMPGHFRGMYLDLLKLSLTDLLYEDDPETIQRRADGVDWPGRAVTMIGLKRLDNLQACIEDVLLKRVPGDLLEAGAWRGGACILMRAVLKEYDDTTRKVWIADSFEGLPKPTSWIDKTEKLHTMPYLAVSVEEVKANFQRFGLLDDQAQFLKGWFKDTLGKAPIEQLAILRMDGDYYDSTMDTLVPLYPKLSPGGFCIADDYHVVKGSKAAIDEYRAKHNITEPIQEIDGSGIFWQKRK